MRDSSGNSSPRFTERARKVLSLAQEEALRFNHNYMGTEHILLGLVREGEGVAARVLANLGIDPPKVRNAIEFIIGRGERQVVGEIGLTPRAKKIIELAVDESRRLGHDYVGTEHLLLGIIREGEGIASGVMESLGVNLERVRSEVMTVLTETGPEWEPEYPPLSPSAQPWGVPPTHASERRWTYLMLHVGRREGRPVVEKVLSPSGGTDIESSSDLFEALSRAGVLGWELVGIDQGKTEDADPTIYVFKRPL